jgi:chromosome segregation ATPase
MAKSHTAGTVSSPPSSAGVPSRTSTPLPGNEARISLDSPRGSLEESISTGAILTGIASASASAPRGSYDSGTRSQGSKEFPPSDRDVNDLIDDAPDREEEPEDKEASDPFLARTSLSDDHEAALAQLQVEHRASELRWQEEMHGYIEKIDALQSKLKYLAKEAAESAKEAALSATPGSVERQLAEKDERIALLLEEGQRLSKTELDNRTVIKRLRQQIAENSKSQADAKRRMDKLEKNLSNAEARAQRAEAAERRANDALNSQSKTAKELEAVTSERNALSSTVEETKAQLARAVARAEAAESRAQSDALEQSRRRIIDLEDDLSSAKIERELSEEKLRREIRDLRDSLEREKEGARVLEAELKGEQSVLESKMENLRSRAEEVSSSAAGDAQAKLLRQIETLQTQYAVASENWQGIESSLLSRLASVEKERDEIARKEADLRRKAREVVRIVSSSILSSNTLANEVSFQNIKAKKVEEELENSREVIEELERSLQESREEVRKMQQRVQKAEDDLSAAKKEFMEQQKTMEAIWTQKLEEERTKWREQAPSPSSFLQQPRTESPVASSRRSTGLEPVPDSRPLSRRSSTLPAQVVDIMTPPRQNSLPSFSQVGVSNGLPNPTLLGTPSIHALEPEEDFLGPATPATPSAYGAQTTHSRGINDIISVSTVGAGPSVQLVERMSATVRRLESERAATKDELARITAQRDEARQEVVELMREIEEKRKSDTRVQELEAQVEQLDQRYQTTLELLGEKSEQVEELQADIADLKKIYRELVDSTMK